MSENVENAVGKGEIAPQTFSKDLCEKKDRWTDNSNTILPLFYQHGRLKT